MIKTAEEKGELKKKSAAVLFSQSVKDLMKSLGRKGKMIDSTYEKKKEIAGKKSERQKNNDIDLLNVQEKVKSESTENRDEVLKKVKRNTLDDLDSVSAQHISMSVEEDVNLERCWMDSFRKGFRMSLRIRKNGKKKLDVHLRAS